MFFVDRYISFQRERMNEGEYSSQAEEHTTVTERARITLSLGSTFTKHSFIKDRGIKEGEHSC